MTLEESILSLQRSVLDALEIIKQQHLMMGNLSEAVQLQTETIRHLNTRLTHLENLK